MRQPERSESGARDRYLAVLRRSLSCINASVDLYLGRVGTLWALSTTERPVVLTAGEHGKPLFLTVEQSVEMVPHPEFAGDYKCSTRSYYYGVYESDDVDHTYPIIAWHWQPEDANWPQPHLHAPMPDDLGRHQVGGRLHVPTGARVMLEHVIRFLIEEGLAASVEDDWNERLGDGETRVEQFGSEDFRSN